jgi:folate-binding protein YgfZ
VARDDEIPIRREAEALIRAAGLHRRGAHALLRVTGADRLDYLHRMLTQRVSDLAAGQAVQACLLTVQGRILGDLLVWNAGDHVRLETTRAALPGVRPLLERYVVADDVAFADESATEAAYVLAGPDALGVLVRAELPVPVEGAFAEVREGGALTRILRLGRRGLSCYELRVPAQGASALEARLLATQDVLLAGPRAWAWCCVHHGIPVFGRELGEDVLFNEAGLEEAIAWDKGCFPGQEPVTMARHRGRPPRRLVAVHLEDERPVERGSDVRAGDRSVGRVTAWAPALAGRAARCLAYVRADAAEEGRRVRVDGGGPGTIHGPSASGVAS